MDKTFDAPSPAGSAWAVGLAGALALAVAMGIGRFAFTPLLPLMQREGLVGDAQGAALAAINYAGYLLGALTAARLARHPRRLVLGSLIGIVLVTAAAGGVGQFGAWMLLRGSAGMLSAWTMVGVSAWAIGELARRGRPDLGGVVYAGVGVGIVLAGGWAWWQADAGAAALWVHLGLLAAPAIFVVAWAWRRDQPAAAQPGAAAPGAKSACGEWGLVIAYGLFGFGYILPATYLPAMARAIVDDPRLFGLAWPVFGTAAAVSTLIAGRLIKRWRLQDIWAVCHAMMAVGALLPLVSRSAAAIGAASLAVGGSFMVATMAGLQMARARAAANPAPLLARMVASFAAGQIAGPLVTVLIARAWGGSGIEPTLAIAAVLLAASGWWLYRLSSSEGEPAHGHQAPAATR